MTVILESKNFIDEEIWETWKGGMEFAFSKPAFKQAWAKIKLDTQYSDEFNKLVDNRGEIADKDIS